MQFTQIKVESILITSLFALVKIFFENCTSKIENEKCLDARQIFSQKQLKLSNRITTVKKKKYSLSRNQNTFSFAFFLIKPIHGQFFEPFQTKNQPDPDDKTIYRLEQYTLHKMETISKRNLKKFLERSFFYIFDKLPNNFHSL